MFKGWTNWIVKSLCRVLLISGLTVMLTWNMVEMYMNRWIAELGLADEVGRAHFKDWLLHLSGAEGRAISTQSPFERLMEQNAEGDDGNSVLAGETTYSDDMAWNGNSEDTGISETQPGQPDQVEGGQSDAVPVFGYLLEEDQAQGDETVMSSQDLAWWQDSMSDEDKMTIFSLVMAKLPHHEYQNLSYLFEGGLTVDETVQIYEILSRYLTEEEMSELANILQKYE